MMRIGRFAPTPSGRLHPGNLVCAMLAYLSIRSQGGRFLLRIEDLDVPRCPKQLAQACVDDLRWLGFHWDEAPVYQSERTEAYRQALDVLTAKGLVYPCFCTRAQLHATVAPNRGDQRFIYPGTCAGLTAAKIAVKKTQRSPALRLRVSDQPVTFHDFCYGEQKDIPSAESGDFIIQRSDGLFAYQLAVVVDDIASGVNEVVRGEDILPATAGQIFLIAQLGASVPEYGHIPLLTDSEGKRLAKRDQAVNLSTLAKKYRPEEILGFLAMASGLQDEPTPRTLEQLIPLMDWQKIKQGNWHLPAALLG